MKTKKPSKQRKRLYKGKLHERKKLLVAHLSKELRKETGKRNLTVRKDDKVKVVRGKYKKTEGKITKVDHKKAKVFIDKITRKKADGTERQIPIKASNLIIIELEGKDNTRIKKKEKEEVAKKEKIAEKKEGKKIEIKKEDSKEKVEEKKEKGIKENKKEEK
jgi:large subunit ribosomal protein L24